MVEPAVAQAFRERRRWAVADELGCGHGWQLADTDRVETFLDQLTGGKSEWCRHVEDHRARRMLPDRAADVRDDRRGPEIIGNSAWPQALVALNPEAGGKGLIDGPRRQVP